MNSVLLRRKIVFVRDLPPSDGKPGITICGRSVGHAGKNLKGLLARAILQEDARTASDIADLRVPGLAQGIRDQANGNKIVFIREV